MNLSGVLGLLKIFFSAANKRSVSSGVKTGYKNQKFFYINCSAFIHRTFKAFSHEKTGQLNCNTNHKVFKTCFIVFQEIVLSSPVMTSPWAFKYLRALFHNLKEMPAGSFTWHSEVWFTITTGYLLNKIWKTLFLKQQILQVVIKQNFCLKPIVQVDHFVFTYVSNGLWCQWQFLSSSS